MERLQSCLHCLTRGCAGRRRAMVDTEESPTSTLTEEKSEVVVSLSPAKIDGGYGWVIVFASFLAHLTLFGVCWSVGMFNVMFLDTFKQSSSATAWVGSLLNALMNVSGMASSALVSRYGCRMVLLLGGSISALGIVLSALSDRLLHVYFTFSVLGGVGLGLAYIPAVVGVSEWFQRRRTIAFGIAVSGAGLGGFVFPPIIRVLTENYSWRTVLLVVAAIMLVTLTAAAALMSPPPAGKPTSTAPEPTNGCSGRLAELKGNLWVMRSFPMVILSVNNFMFCFGQVIVYVHLGAFAISSGHIDYSGTDFLFSVIGVSNLIGRIAHGLLCHLPGLASLSVYLVSSAVSGAAVLLITTCSSVTTLAVCSALFGFASCCMGVLLPDIIISLVGQQRLAITYGMLMIPEGLGFLLGGPAAGLLYDYTGIYKSSFLLAGALLVASSLLLVVPWWCFPSSLSSPSLYVSRHSSESSQAPNTPSTPAKCPPDPADFLPFTDPASFTDPAVADQHVTLDVDLYDGECCDDPPYWMSKHCNPSTTEYHKETEDGQQSVVLLPSSCTSVSIEGQLYTCTSPDDPEICMPLIPDSPEICMPLIPDSHEMCIPLMPDSSEMCMPLIIPESEQSLLPQTSEDEETCSSVLSENEER